MVKKNTKKENKTKNSTKSKSSKTKIKAKLKKKINDEHCFIMITGHKIKNVKELAEILENVDDEHFNHHVTEDKNDFSNWVRDIFEEHTLADQLKKAKNKEQTRIIIYKHIANNFW